MSGGQNQSGTVLGVAFVILLSWLWGIVCGVSFLWMQGFFNG